MTDHLDERGRKMSNCKRAVSSQHSAFSPRTLSAEGRQRRGHGKGQSENYFVVHWSPALGSDRERASLLWLGLRPQEIWAEQIPRPYFHPKTRKNHARVGDPGYSRADEHPIHAQKRRAM